MRKWNNIPKELKNRKVKEYYEILSKRKISLMFKRFFDIIASLVLIILLLPVMVIIAILIKFDSKGPVFFRQERVTIYNKNFKIYKFRTMVSNADKIGTLVTVENDSRITRVGKLIRKCRLDELPQLINVLIGDMTFVGTRPEVRKYVNEYSDEMKATLLLRAGITSLASIKYKDEDEIMAKFISEGLNIDEAYVEKILPEKMKYNLESIKKFSILNDMKLMLKTVIAVIK